MIYHNHLTVKTGTSQLLDLFNQNSWTLLKDEIPTVEKHGEKVLIVRLLNGGQAAQSISIHDTKMMKHCNPDETFWMVHPELPKFK